MNMSFMLTKPQIRNRSKRVTRRLGWRSTLEVGAIVTAVERAQGLRKGQKVRPMDRVRIIGVRVEPLRRMTEDPAYGAAECVLEGFPELTPAEFVAMFCSTHRLPALYIDKQRVQAARQVTPDDLVTRIEFDYVGPPC